MAVGWLEKYLEHLVQESLSKSSAIGWLKKSTLNIPPVTLWSFARAVGWLKKSTLNIYIPTTTGMETAVGWLEKVLWSSILWRWQKQLICRLIEKGILNFVRSFSVNSFIADWKSVWDAVFPGVCGFRYRLIEKAPWTSRSHCHQVIFWLYVD